MLNTLELSSACTCVQVYVHKQYKKCMFHCAVLYYTQSGVLLSMLNRQVFCKKKSMMKADFCFNCLQATICKMQHHELQIICKQLIEIAEMKICF